MILSSLVLLISLTSLGFSTFTNTGLSLTSSFTLDSSVTYTMNFSLSSTVSANSDVVISLSDRYSVTSALSGCKASLSSSVALATATCTSNYSDVNSLYYLTFSGLYPSASTQNFLSLQFIIDNPWGKTTQTVTVYITDPLNINTFGQTVYIEYVASTMAPCTITSSSQITGENSTVTVQFLPNKKLIANSYLMIDMDYWFLTSVPSATSLTSCVGISNTDSASLGCSIRSIGSKQTINITNFVTTTKTVSSKVSIQISFLRNPWSLAPFGPITYSLTNNNTIVSQSCTNIYHTVTTPNTPTNVIFAISNLGISQTSSNIVCQFITKNPITKSGSQLRFVFDSAINFTYSGSNSIQSQGSNFIVFQNIAPADSSSILVLSVSKFSITNPPSTKSFKIVINDQVVINGTAYKIDQKTMSYQATAGSISTLVVNAPIYSINRQTTYTITFTTINNLITGSFINVVFPSELTINTAQGCSTNLTSTMSCSAVSTSNVTLSLTNSLSGGTSISVVISNVTNGPQSSTTGSFLVYTYYTSNAYDTLVDQSPSGVTVTLVSNNLVSASVTPSNLTTFVVTTYAFSAQLSDDIPQGGYIQVTFPSSVTPSSPALASASFPNSTCQIVTPSTQVVQIKNCFISGALSKGTITFTISGIRNPNSLKPSTTFQIRTYNSLYQVNKLTSGIIATMTNPNYLTAFTINPANTVVHKTNTYTISLTHLITNHILTDYYIITLPSYLSFPTSPSCTPTEGVTAVACSLLSTTQLKVIYNSALSGTRVTIDLANMVNYDVGDFAVSISVKTYNTENYEMETSNPPASITFSEDTITTFSVNNDLNIALNEASNITIVLTAPFIMSSALVSTLTALIVTIPSQFTIGTTCSSSSGTCSPISTTQYKIDNVGLNVTNLVITMKDIVLPYFDPNSNSFTLQYTYNGYNVSTVGTGVVVYPYCTSPCQRCNATKTQCLSCLSAPNTAKYYDPVKLTCLTTCDVGKYADAKNECQFCVSPCSQCYDSANCSKCVSNTWLYQNSCLLICPDGYFNDSSGVCIACQSPCDTCLSLSKCTSCLINYLSGTDCVTAANCPSSTFPNTTSLVCQSCTSPCANCSLSSTNCTSCVTGYLYYSNICVQNCPSGMYKNSPYCFNCAYPCATCNSSTYCLSCVDKYLTNGTCVDSNSCPNATYPNSTTLQCALCPSGCTTCTNSTNCSACSTPIYFFYQYTCVTKCPSGTFKESIVCRSCDSPCATCVTNSTNCLSCTSPQLLYNNTCLDTCPDKTYPGTTACQACLSSCATCTNGTKCSSCSGNLYLDSSFTCSSTCPSGTFTDSSNNNCTLCSPPCSTCSLSGTNCTTCVSPQLMYSYKCQDSCPDQYFNVSGVCKTCSNCSNCLDASTCQTCLTGFLLYAGTCYQTCPSQAPIQDAVNKQCIACDAQCATCSTSSKNCLSCYGGQYLFNNNCLSSCPSGYVQDTSSGTCTQPILGGMIYMPCSITAVALIIILIYSACRYPKTQPIPLLTSFLTFCEYLSWVIITFILLADVTLQQSVILACFLVGLAVLILGLITGITYVVTIYCIFSQDKGFFQWKKYDNFCACSYRTINTFSIFNFRSFRFIYAKIFDKYYFSAFFSDGGRFLAITNRLSYASILYLSLPMVAMCSTVLYFKQIPDITFFSCVDTLILTSLTSIMLIIDSAKGAEYFEKMRGQLPFLRYDDLEGDSIADMNSRKHLLMQDQDGERKAKTDCSENSKQRIFKAIDFCDPNKYGYLNQLQIQENKRQTKSLPQLDDLRKMDDYDPDDDDRVRFDRIFEDQQERRRKKQLQQLQRLRRIQQQEQQRLRKQQQQRRRRQRQLQDLEERQNLDFVDHSKIEKYERQQLGIKNNRVSPLEHLKNCKKTDQKKIDQKSAKKLANLAQKNGLNSEFMKETFGVEKNHNAELLNGIIDKHGGVKRQAVKQLFNQQSNEEILQQLFGKNSTMDKQKLKQLMNDPDSKDILKKLVDKQQGILSAEMAKQLLSKDSKYSKEFMLNLLNPNKNQINGDGQDGIGKGTGMDQEKLKQVLKNADGKGKNSPLKALQKIGGQNLENKEMLNNMLGKQAVLNPQQFTKVANDLSAKAIENLFQNKSQRNDIITKKLLNNKKIDLKGLSPILQDEQLLQQLAKAFGQEDPAIEETLLKLFKDSNDIDPAKLGQLLRDPVLVQKLLKNEVDEVFLRQLLKKDANTDFQMLSKILKDMPNEDIQQNFKYKLGKNTDFQALATLFEKNSKTDPKLLKKMLDPEVVNDLFMKGSTNPKMLLKYVEKGANFDPDLVRKIHKNNNDIFRQNSNNPLDDILERDKKDNMDSLSQKHNNVMGKTFNRNKMSRTDIGNGGFFGQLVPIRNKNKIGNNNNLLNQMSDTHFEQSQQGSGREEDEYTQGEEIVEFIEDDDDGKRPRRKLKKKKKNQFSDIRLKAQEIYLQRLEAPHEAKMRKNTSIRKKKQKSTTTMKFQAMDSDNDVYDMNF